MIILTIPKDGASDIEVTIVSLAQQNGSEIKKDDIILEYETSKAILSMQSPKDGYIYYLCGENEVKSVAKDPICFISDSLIESDQIDKMINNVSNKNKNKEEKDHTVTKKAQMLIDQNNINIQELGTSVITEQIVRDYLDKKDKKKTVYSFNENDIAIYGIGGHAGVCIDILNENKSHNIAGFLDDNKHLDNIYGLKYLGGSDLFGHLSGSGLKSMIIGMGMIHDLRKREKIFKKSYNYFEIPTIIHKAAIIEKTAKIGVGCQIMAGAIIGSNVEIGDNCIINSGAIICHDTRIGNSSHITPGATLAGNVMIGERVTVGMCSTIYLGTIINDDIVIKNNQSVFSEK